MKVENKNLRQYQCLDLPEGTVIGWHEGGAIKYIQGRNKKQVEQAWLIIEIYEKKKELEDFKETK